MVFHTVVYPSVRGLTYVGRPGILSAIQRLRGRSLHATLAETVCTPRCGARSFSLLHRSFENNTKSRYNSEYKIPDKSAFKVPFRQMRPSQAAPPTYTSSGGPCGRRDTKWGIAHTRDHSRCELMLHDSTLCTGNSSLCTSLFMRVFRWMGPFLGGTKICSRSSRGSRATLPCRPSSVSLSRWSTAAA